MSLADLVVSIVGDIGDIKKAFAQVSNDAVSLGKDISKVGASLSSTGSSLTKRITAPLLAVGAGIGVVSGKASSFEKQMAEVFTLLPDLSDEGMGAMTEDALEFSKEMGVLTDEMVPALYQAISAGVPDNNVFDFLTIAQKAAVGGVSDLESTVDGITSVVNAYGEDVINATETSDLMFTAVKKGKTTFDELSSSLYNVIPYASAAGVEFGDVTAAIATLTAQGTPTAQATTQIRQAIVELSDSGSQVGKIFKEIAGVSFKEFIAQGHNTQDVLVLLDDYAKQSGLGIDELFSSVEAGAAVIGLTGKSADTFTGNLVEMETAAGATDAAYAKMQDTAAHGWDEIKATLDAILIGLGQEFLPVLRNDILPIIKDTIVPLLTDVIIPAITILIQAFGKLSKPMKIAVLAVTGFMTALGPILVIAGSIVNAVGAITTALGSAGLIGAEASIGTALAGFAATIAPIVAAAAALAAVGYLIYKNWDTIAPIIESAMDVVWEAVEPIVTMIVDFVTEQFDKVTAWWDENGTLIIEAATVVLTAIWDMLSPYYNLVKILLNSILNAVKTALPNIIDVVDGFITIILDVITLVAQVLTGDWDGAWNTALDIVRTIGDNMVSSFKATVNLIIGFINGLIDGLNGIDFEVPEWLSDLTGMGNWSFSIPSIPALAEGGRITSAGTVLVGEEGPEFLNLPSGASVTPLDKTSSTVFNFERMFEGAILQVREDNDIKKLAKEIHSIIKSSSRSCGVIY